MAALTRRAALLGSLATLAILGVLLAGRGAAAGAGPPYLYVTYSDSAPQIALADGTPVGDPGAPGAPIPAGTYLVDVVDQDGPPSFELSGPGVWLLDTEQTEAVFTVFLAPSSTYSFDDTNDPSASERVFTTSAVVTPPAVTTAPTPTGPPQGNASVIGSASAPVSGTDAGSLTASVSVLGHVSLTEDGASVGQLKPGRYTLTVTDDSTTAGFALERRGQRRLVVSAGAFSGRRSLSVELAAGTWFAYGLAAQKREFVVV